MKGAVIPRFVVALGLCIGAAVEAGSSPSICEQLKSDLGYSGLSQIKGFVSPKAFSALDDYKGVSYSRLNGYLRQNASDFDAGYRLQDGGAVPIPVDATVLTIHLLDTIFYSLPVLPKNVILFRGNTLGYRANKAHAPESTLREWAYLSTSARLRTAAAFAHSSLSDEKGQIMAFYFSETASRRAIVICDAKEEEVLLPRGRDLKVMDETLLEDGNLTLSLVQICGPNCDWKIPASTEAVWQKIKAEPFSFVNAY
jgi:hypothetical protein